MLYILLAGSISILLPTALAVLTKAALAGQRHQHRHGILTETLPAPASANANSGQSFAGLNANSTFYNLTTAISMMVGRFGLAIPALALAGLFAAQQSSPRCAHAARDLLVVRLVAFFHLLRLLPTHRFPALALGPDSGTPDHGVHNMAGIGNGAEI